MSGRGWRSRFLARCQLYAVGRLAGLAALLAVAAIVLGVPALAPTTADRNYTVAKVERGLVRNPGVWVGRTVRVRGDVVVLKAVSSRGSSPVDGGTYHCAPFDAVPWLIRPCPPARLHAVTMDNGPSLSLPATQALFMQLNVGRKPSYPVVHLVIGIQPPLTNSVLGALRQVLVIRLFLPAAATVPRHVEAVYQIHILGRG